jgi:hypothetical protein
MSRSSLARLRTWGLGVCIPVIVLACGASAATTPTGTPLLPSQEITKPSAGAATLPGSNPAPAAGTVPTLPAPAVATRPPAQPVFTLAVLVDTRAEPVSREQAQAVINEAGRHLRELVPVDLVMTDFVEDGSGGATTEMVQRYLVGHAGALPNGVVIFSAGDNGRAKLNGGYAYAVPGPAGYRNTFASAVIGSSQIYVAVVHFSQKYMPCGYGGKDTVQSHTASAGECGNHPGTACVEQNGYSMCSSAVGTLYMSTPTYFVSSTILHELLHLFAPNGDMDNYSTPECTARMGYPAGFYDLQEAQYHSDLCPNVYDDFVKAYQP